MIEIDAYVFALLFGAFGFVGFAIGVWSERRYAKNATKHLTREAYELANRAERYGQDEFARRVRSLARSQSNADDAKEADASHEVIR